MPVPLPHYRPTFSAAELEHARRVAAQTSAPHREVVRARLALAVAAHPEWSHNEIAELCGVREQMVYKWRRRWATSGFSLQDAPRPGRPRVFSP